MLQKRYDKRNGQGMIGRSLGWVFNFRIGRLYVIHFCCFEAKQPIL